MQKKLIAGVWLSVFSLTSFTSMVLAAPAPITTLTPAATACAHTGSGTDYQVGPGKQYTSIGQVPFEDLVAGDTVRIFWRTESYKEKMMISAQGTASQPVVVCGVAGPSGQLPVIDGQNAVTRPQLEFPFNGDNTDGGHQPRGLIIIGHAHDDQDYSNEPRYVTVQGLEIRNASTPYSFTDRAGDVRAYPHNAAGIFIQRGQNITIRGNIITENGNGVFGGTGGGEELMENILFEGNYIFKNGNPDRDREHNVYMDGSNITYQFNRFGSTRNGGLQGGNIKERSAGVVIRYNWIEDGAHLLDLVHAQEAASSTVSMPSYRTTEVYGNVLVRSDHAGSMVHYGGDDSGNTQDFRKGTLKFYNNTVIVNNANVEAYSKPALFAISTDDETLDARNNIFYLSTIPGENKEVNLLGKRDGRTSGVANFLNNWFATGWTAHEPAGQYHTVSVEYTGFPSNLTGTNPGFVDVAAGNYGLLSNASVQGAGSAVPLSIGHQYVKHQSAKTRADAAGTTLGAFTDSSTTTNPSPTPTPTPEPTPTPTPEPSPTPAPEQPTTPEPQEPTTPSTCSKFVDINSNDPNYAAYQYVKSIGAMTGNPDCTFDPQGLLQRDQSAKIVLEMIDVYESTVDYCKGIRPFSDVAENSWAYQYICLAKNRNVVSGYASGADAGKFVPGRTLNRVEALAIVLRNLENENIPSNASSSYDDVQGGQWFSGYARYAQDKGLFLGSNLYPANGMTRGEFAVMLYRLHQLGKI